MNQLTTLAQWAVLGLAAVLSLGTWFASVIFAIVVIGGGSRGPGDLAINCAFVLAPFGIGAGAWFAVGRFGLSDPVIRLAVTLSVVAVLPVMYMTCVGAVILVSG